MKRLCDQPAYQGYLSQEYGAAVNNHAGMALYCQVGPMDPDRERQAFASFRKARKRRLRRAR